MNNSNLNKKVTLAVLSILLFAITYVVLIAFAIGLTIVCGWLGIMILTINFSLITIVVGLALFVLGILVLYFLLKFSFQKREKDDTLRLQIYENDYPRLFQMIRELSEKIDTRFPKKIYLIADVNASVFYDSSFWSMFFPTGKNLQIGLGLVSSLTDEELKAIIAHELGHFSQKSMTVGSYVYQVNQLIYNLLYKNSYHETLSSWGNIHGAFALSAGASFYIIRGIQWVLRQLYRVVNVSYLELSREMEFHADAIAAQATNPEVMIDSLVKIDFTGTIFQEVLDYYTGLVPLCKKTENLFLSYLFAIQIQAKRYKFPLKMGLPVISTEEIYKLLISRINIKDQWASHPTTEQRIARLEEQANSTPIDKNQTAWCYFNDPENVQKAITELVYSPVVFEKDPENESPVEFENECERLENNRKLNPIYKGYYDSKDISKFDLEKACEEASQYKALVFEDIINDENNSLVRQEKGLDYDINLLQSIDNEEIDVRFFDFDGIKHRKEDAYDIKQQLSREKDMIEKRLKENDVKAFSFFYLKMQHPDEINTLKNLYFDYFQDLETFSKSYTVYLEIIKLTQFIQSGKPINEVGYRINTFTKEESVMKEKLAELMQSPEIDTTLKPYEKEEIERYLSEDWIYLEGTFFNDAAFSLLYRATYSFYFLSNMAAFYSKKKVLEYQASCLLGVSV